MTEIVERLERQAINVENDGHVSAARAMRDAATALTEARAEIERLTEQALVKDHAIIEAAKLAKRLMTRALAAESELSTLRARVREVVGPFAKDFDLNDCADRDDIDAMEVSIGHLRAARQLNEDLK